MNCPKCGLLNNDSTALCECGYDFETEDILLRTQKSEELKQNKEGFENKLQALLITTTTSIDGRKVVEYKGIVTTQVLMGGNLFKDIFSGFRDIVGGRSKAMETEFNKAKELLLRELGDEAVNLRANAIIGLKIDFEDVGKVSGNAFMLLGTGTGVIIE